ncbi:MAG: chemotaxis protein CheW [Candidatus Aminicenantes bacterium]|jgi:purine-binding chemotaxis protein CheW|nr:chemotaxis protein CheW [Candidatus Aminicenantes bacterium]
MNEHDMNMSNQLVVFALDEQRYALHLSAVERIVRVAEVTPLPKAPEIVLGVINVQGQIIPVADIRRRFRLPEREIDLSDHLIIAHTPNRTVALVVDEVTGVIESPEQKLIPAKEILPGTDYVEGVMKLEDGLILIHDLATFLSLEEENTLDLALKTRKGQK